MLAEMHGEGKYLLAGVLEDYSSRTQSDWSMEHCQRMMQLLVKKFVVGILEDDYDHL